MREVWTWNVGNIPGKNISSGESLLDYVSTGPPKDMGMNRYFYFIFRQLGLIDFTNEPHADKYNVNGRLYRDVREFAEDHTLGSPVAMNFIVAYFDEQTNNLYRQLNCCEDLM